MFIIPPKVTQLLASILSLDDTDLAILSDIVRQCRNRTAAATRSMSFHVHLTTRAIRYRLAKLSKIGLVQRVGHRKGWILNFQHK